MSKSLFKNLKTVKTASEECQDGSDAFFSNQPERGSCILFYIIGLEVAGERTILSNANLDAFWTAVTDCFLDMIDGNLHPHQLFLENVIIKSAHCAGKAQFQEIV